MAARRSVATVFISHSAQDIELVRDLARRLRARGLTPLESFAEVPAGTAPGDWKKTLRGQIQRADAILVLVTPAALQSPWMMTELGMAEGFDRVVLPVTAGVKPGDLPAPLESYQVTPFDEVDGAIQALSERFMPATKS